MKKIVYADNAATTALSKQALKAMMPYLTKEYGNPSTLYSLGRNARKALEQARVNVARAIGSQQEEIYFTSGGTEANNWAIKSAAELKKDQGKHIISSTVEHHAVLHTLQNLEKQGYHVTYLGVNEFGQVSIDDLQRAIRKDTILITIMTANNEIGTILPVEKIGAIARKNEILFHTDAVQAVGHIPVHVETMNIDMLSLAGHKFRGPKGTGALYVKKGINLPSYMLGGGQESNLRSGTENVAGIIGLAAALKEATVNMEENMKKVSSMRDRIIDKLLKIPCTKLTGDPINRLPGIASFIFECVEGESMVMFLDQNGICASSGSACSSGSQGASHVLSAIGLPPQLAHSSLRLSLSEDNSEEDIDYILEKLPQAISRLREMSPLWNQKLSGVKY
jgi:cysteine desulfurase